MIQKIGSFAQTKLPAAVSNNTFNAANEMTSFNGTALTYDANGNLTNDGTNIYSWDARNHLVGITGANTASFVYDADGRRSLKSINGTTTQFLYDGLNPVQELQNAAPSANMLTGLGIDEYLQRTDSGGVRDYLSDILGSTVALTGTSGSIQTQYTYSPFGNASASGTASSNPYQFTARENDGIGLDYYRARYYSPTQQRFIGQDPIDFRANGPNLYGYVENDPTNELDPLGLKITPCKNGDCPDPAPTDASWRRGDKEWWWARLPRQYGTHPGQVCYEKMVNGKYQHCCYDSQGHPIYGPNGGAWEDWDPNNLFQWPLHVGEWFCYKHPELCAF